MPTFGVDGAIRGHQMDGDPPAGWATIIDGSDCSIDKLDIFVTQWTHPSHTLDSKIGEEKIENGSSIHDHIVTMPVMLSLTGDVSDMSMGPDYCEQAWSEVRKLQNEDAILHVITEWGVYKEMVIKHASTQQRHRGMEFTLELQQIRRVGVGETQQLAAAAADPNNAAANKSSEVTTGPKDLKIPVTPLGNNQFLTGLPDSPDRQIIEKQSDGTYITIEPDS